MIPTRETRATSAGRFPCTLIAAVVACSCSGLTSSPGSSRLDDAALEQATYCSSFLSGEGPVTLHDGRYESANADARETVMLMEPRPTGDLDGDGREDAAVLLVSSGGGSGVFVELAAVVNRGGVAVHVASAPLGDRVKVKSLAIQEGVIRVEMVTHDEDDAACCPTLDVTISYGLRGGRLVEVGSREA